MMALSVADVTVTPAFPETEFMVAVTVTVPAFNECSRPAPLTVATAGSELCQVTCVVSTWVVLSV